MKPNLSKRKLVAMLGGTCGAVLVASVAAAGEVVSRSTADMEADLMRTYQTHGGIPASNIQVRSADDARADLMRDWNAKPSGAPGPSLRTRSEGEAYADLMRFWGPVATVK